MAISGWITTSELLHTLDLLGSRAHHMRLGRDLVSSSLMGSLAKGFLRKVCRNSAESSRKFAKMRFVASEKGAEILRKVAEISRKFADNFLQ